ncbi:MAG: glycosyltransferase involved in cell wall biosynthesis [Acidimicrobiales bacterium]|jgi:glycosyltransferase involved in cell wall biosynthesis
MSVAAIMPTYNQPQFIEAAVRSVVGQVDLLVIVDDGSTNDAELERFLEFPNVQICRHASNCGTAAAINTGFDEVPDDYDWITWVSSDNVHTDNWMPELLGQAERPGIGAVYSDFHYCFPGRRSTVLGTAHEHDKLINQENCYYGPSFLIRNDMWQSHRGKISHDYDNWLRVEEACWDADLRIQRVPLPLCYYNAHAARVTLTRKHEYDVPKWQAEGRLRRNSQ